jgi:hypothetical protein
MGIFRQKVVIDSAIDAQDAWRRLRPLVRTNLPICAVCGHNMAEAGLVRFCSHCGQPVPLPLPQTWAQRNFSPGGFEFEGDLLPQGFNISPIFTYTYRNSCYPIIRGRFEPSATGTRIVIDIKMNILGYLFLFGAGTVSFLVLSVLAANGQGLPATAILAFAAPCFFFAVCWVAFAVGASMARGTLSQVWPSR